MVELTLRVVVSLGVVLGLFWMVARTGSRKMGGRDRALVKVRSRQSLSRGSSLAVVEVGTRILVVGVSDNGVRLLTEMDPSELAAPAAVTEPDLLPAGLPLAELDGSYDSYDSYEDDDESSDEAALETYPSSFPEQAASSGGALSGSILDGAVWRDAWASAVGRAQRNADGNAA